MATKKKPLRIIGLKKSPSKADKDNYSFGVCCVGGLIFNGFLYRRDSRSILAPGFMMKGKRYPFVKGHGVHWARLRDMVEEELESYGN